MTGPTRGDVQIVEPSPKGWSGKAWHIQIGDKHYVISALPGETMAFACDENCDVTSWSELAVVHRADHEACIADLLKRLAGGA